MQQAKDPAEEQLSASNSKEALLIIEDEEALGEGLRFNFEAEGFDVVWEKDGLAGMAAIANLHESLTVVILDLMLPELDGYEILRRTREIAEQIPIIVLSAKSLETDKIKALELGADDYVTKPFSLVELILRVKGISKRKKWYKNSLNDTKIQLGKANFSSQKLTVETADGAVTRISPTEVLLAQTFLDFENKIVTRAELLEKVWHYDAKMETRTVDVFVSKLRKYIEENPAKPKHLLSVRGVGYAYVTDANLREQLRARG